MPLAGMNSNLDMTDCKFNKTSPPKWVCSFVTISMQKADHGMAGSRFYIKRIIGNFCLENETSCFGILHLFISLLCALGLLVRSQVSFKGVLHRGNGF